MLRVITAPGDHALFCGMGSQMCMEMLSQLLLCAAQWLGKLAIVAVPALIALAIFAGLFAAATYNAGADQVLKP